MIGLFILHSKMTYFLHSAAVGSTQSTSQVPASASEPHGHTSAAVRLEAGPS
jgi:hypothetical protein